MSEPKILLLDIETSPIVGHVWKLFDQNVGLNQIEHDWAILSWSAKWLGKKKIYYQDVRNQKNKRDDSKILKDIWRLMDEADIIVGQNSKQFDIKKLNARFIINGMKPPSSYRQHDTRLMARKIFGFTSNKLEYLADNLCVKYKKLKHSKFSGHALWTECLKGNQAAWREMEKYNKHDVLALEELYVKLRSWDAPINYDVFRDDEQNLCECGHPSFVKWGFRFTNTGKFQRFKCRSCGRETVGKENLIPKEKRKTLRK
jgi:DNA polymerase elongation subunit (family B)